MFFFWREEEEFSFILASYRSNNYHWVTLVPTATYSMRVLGAYIPYKHGLCVWGGSKWVCGGWKSDKWKYSTTPNKLFQVNPLCVVYEPTYIYLWRFWDLSCRCSTCPPAGRVNRSKYLSSPPKEAIWALRPH